MARFPLPVGWAQQLLKPTGVKPYLEIIIDPDDRALKPSGFYDIKAIGVITTGINLDLSMMFDTVLYDMEVNFLDIDEFFSMYSTRGGYRPLRNIQRVLNETVSGSSVTLRDGLFDFEVGDRAIITDGTNRENITISGVSGNVISWNETLSNTYNAGDVVSTLPQANDVVQIQMGLKSVDAKLNIFEGNIREPFETNDLQAILRIDNAMSKVLNRGLRIQSTSPNPTQRCNASGSLATSLTWNDGASGTLSGVTVYSGAKLGKWTITFSDTTNFTVTGANCNSKAGDINTDFYDQTDATDSQIYIPSANWGGSPAADDVLTFYISANFSAKTVPEMVYELLNTYGGITDIDVLNSDPTDNSSTGWGDYSFNLAYSKLSSDTLTLSFDEPTTLSQAIMTVLPHGMAALGQMLNGNFRIYLLHPDFHLDDFDDVDFIGNPINLKTDIANEIIVYYGWDYVNATYQYSFTYPERDSDNRSLKLHGKKVSREIYIPAIYSDTDAELIAKKYYSVYKDGLIQFKTQSALTSIKADFGTRLDLSIGNPSVTINNSIIYNIERVLGEQNRIVLYSFRSGFMVDEDNLWT